MVSKRLISIGFSVFLSAAAAEAARIDIVISKPSQKMTVSVDGQVEYVWPVSTGAAGYDTPSGKFKAFRLEEDHESKEWDNAPMPHSIFFTVRGHAIHGSYSKRIGQRASHGCVRLHPENAETLFYLVQENGLGNTHVTIKGGFFESAFNGNDNGGTSATARRSSLIFGSRTNPVSDLRKELRKAETRVKASGAGLSNILGIKPTGKKPRTKTTAKKKKPIVVSSN